MLSAQTIYLETLYLQTLFKSIFKFKKCRELLLICEKCRPFSTVHWCRSTQTVCERLLCYLDLPILEHLLIFHCDLCCLYWHFYCSSNVLVLSVIRIPALTNLLSTNSKLQRQNPLQVIWSNCISWLFCLQSVFASLTGVLPRSKVKSNIFIAELFLSTQRVKAMQMKWLELESIKKTEQGASTGVMNTSHLWLFVCVTWIVCAGGKASPLLDE